VEGSGGEARLFVPRDSNIRSNPAKTTKRNHQFTTNCLKEKGTTRKEKIISIQPRKTKAMAGTTYRMRTAPKWCQPEGKRARPENTESRGQLWEKEKGTIRRAERKRNSPTSRKKVAKNRLSERLFNFIAKKANNTPIITKKKALNTEKGVVPPRVTSKKALPMNISRRPKKNTMCAVILWVVCGAI
jgi:hypothetical protein